MSITFVEKKNMLLMENGNIENVVDSIVTQDYAIFGKLPPVDALLDCRNRLSDKKFIQEIGVQEERIDNEIQGTDWLLAKWSKKLNFR